MTLPSSGSPISFSQLRSEFGTDGNNTSGPVRLGQYRRDDSSFSDKTAGTFVDQPLDTGVPTSGTITMDDMYGKSLNVIVDYHSGSADEGGTRPESARDRYNQSSGSGKWTVIGGYKSPPSNSGGTKVKINVNKGIGGKDGASETAVCALRTGTWDTNTMLSVDIGSAGKISGAGGDGGNGGSNANSGDSGEDANSALGIQYSGTTVNIASGGQIICGYGGGGGGGGAFDEDGFLFFDQERYAGGGGGGGGAGIPAGEGGSGGGGNSGGEGGEGGAAPAGGEQGGEGGEGGNNAGEAVAGRGGRGGDQEETGGESGSDGSGGSGEGAGGGTGEVGWAIRKSASGITWTLNNSGSIIGDQTSTSSGGGGTTVS